MIEMKESKERDYMTMKIEKTTRRPYIRDSLQILRMRKSIHYLSLRLMKYLLIIKLDSLLQIKQSTMNLLVQIEI